MGKILASLVFGVAVLGVASSEASAMYDQDGAGTRYQILKGNPKGL